MKTAQERRYEAIDNLNCGLVDPDGTVLITDRKEVAKRVLSLENMGRTARWQEALSTWAGMVQDESFELRWAIIQGSIYTAFAA